MCNMGNLDEEISREPIDFYNTALGTANGLSKVGGALVTGLGDYTDWMLMTPKGTLQKKGQVLGNLFNDPNNNTPEYKVMTDVTKYGAPLVGLTAVGNPFLSALLGSAINAGLAENEGKEYTATDRAIDFISYGVGQGAGIFAPAFKENLIKSGVTYDPYWLEKIISMGLKGSGNKGTKEVLKNATDEKGR